jgi:hypothetical protein
MPETKEVEIQAALGLLQNRFTRAQVVPYDAQKHAGKIACPHACCTARLHAVDGAPRDGGIDYNRAHLHTSPRKGPRRGKDESKISAHLDDCVFNNMRKPDDRLTFKEAIKNGRPVVVNINFDPAYSILPPVTEDAKNHWHTPYARWAETTGGRGYETVAVHSVADLIDIAKQAEAIGGPDALNLLYFQRKQMILPYNEFWGARFDTPGNSLRNTTWRVLKELYQRAQTFYRLSDIVQASPRLVEFARQAAFNDKNKTLRGETVALDGDDASILVTQNLQFQSTPDLKKIHTLGARFLVVAAPTLYLGETLGERQKTLAALKSVIQAPISDPDHPRVLSLKWMMHADPAPQMTPIPYVQPEQKSLLFPQPAVLAA